MASSTAHRRLLQEYRALTNNPPEGITAGPVSEDDLLYWEALIQGPEDTPFEGGVFPAELKFPKDYPLAPPTMRFLGEVWHPNGKPPLHFPLAAHCVKDWLWQLGQGDWRRGRWKWRTVADGR